MNITVRKQSSISLLSTNLTTPENYDGNNYPLKNISNEDERSNSCAIQENYGRWSKEEHQRFVEAIKMYGKNWKPIEKFIKTRSRPQIRSHAQKFFKRLEISFKQLKRKNSYDDDVVLRNSLQQEGENPINKRKFSDQFLINNNNSDNHFINMLFNKTPKMKPKQNSNSQQYSVLNKNFDSNIKFYQEIKQRSYQMGLFFYCLQVLRKYLKTQLKSLNKIQFEILKLSTIIFVYLIFKDVNKRHKEQSYYYAQDTYIGIQTQLSMLENQFLRTLNNSVKPFQHQLNDSELYCQIMQAINYYFLLISEHMKIKRVDNAKTIQLKDLVNFQKQNKIQICQKDIMSDVELDNQVVDDIKLKLETSKKESVLQKRKRKPKIKRKVKEEDKDNF